MAEQSRRYCYHYFLCCSRLAGGHPAINMDIWLTSSLALISRMPLTLPPSDLPTKFAKTGIVYN